MELLGIAEAFKGQLQQASFQDLSFDEPLGILADRQWIWKRNTRLKRVLKEALNMT